MAKVEEELRGLVRAEITGPEPEKLLNACLAENLPLVRPQSLDRWTLRLGVFEGDFPQLEALAGKCGCEIKIIGRQGGSRTRKLLRRRIGLLLAGCAMLTLLFVSSLFVWEIRLVGAEELSRGELLRALEESGLSCGCFWPKLDADALRDRMLLREPRLAWLAVNIRGSTAEVRLLRREDKPEMRQEGAAADLRAARAGVVRLVSARSGQPLVQAGQAVTTGEVLISGTLDSITASPRSLRAQGEVLADTWYELTAVCPPAQGKESTGAGLRLRFALKIGAKRINFYQNGGKTIDACDKIVHEYNLGIKGLFRLPLVLVREELRPYRAAESAGDPAEELGQRLLASLAERIKGEIVSSALRKAEIDGMTVVTLYAQCRENIAQSVDIIP